MATRGSGRAAIDPIAKDVKSYRGADGDAMALKRVKKDFDRIRSEMEWRREDWKEYNDLYLGHLRLPNNYPLNSRSHIPLNWSMIETMTPHYVDALYDDRAFLAGISRSKDNEKRKIAEDTGRVMNYWYISMMGYLLKLIDTIRGSLVFGTMYQQVILRVESQPVFDPKKQREEENEAEAGEADESAAGPEKEIKGAGTVRKMFFNGPDTKVIPPHDCYPDLPFQEIIDMRFFIHKEIVPASKIIANAFDEEGDPIYKNLSDMLATKLPGDAREDEDDLLAAHSTRGVTRAEEDNSREDKLVERMFYWTPTWLIIVVNRKVVIFNGPNPLPFQGIPYVAFRPTRDTRFHHGIGVPQILRSITKTMNVILNQRLDNLNLVLNPMFKVTRDGQINTAELRAMAGGTINMESLTDLDIITWPDVTGSAMANVQDLSRWADVATGVQEFFRGQAPATSRTPASTVSQIINQTTRRFSLAIRGYQDSILKTVGMSRSIMEHFGDQEMMGRFIGKGGALDIARITRTQLKNADVDFAVLGRATSGNPDILLTKLMEVEERWRGDPQINHRALKSRILDLSGLANIDELLVPDPTEAGGQEQSLEQALAQATGAPDPVQGPAIAEIPQAPGPAENARPVISVPGT